MQKFLIILGLSSLLLNCSSPLEELKELDFGDLQAPNLLQHYMNSEGLIRLEFDEAVFCADDMLYCSEGIYLNLAQEIPQEGSTQILLEIDGTTNPGQAYSFELSVADASGNSLRMILPFYGQNPNPAKLLINELATKTSTKILDAIELYVQDAGNVGGFTVYLGSPETPDARFVFPAFEVSAGDYILLHMKIPESDDLLDELASKTECSNSFACSTAWDFWHPDSPGLPDTSGVVCISENPLAEVSDYVFYSNKAAAPDKAYRGFGTAKLLAWAEYGVNHQAWNTENEEIQANEGANTEGITATRTLGRRYGKEDSNSREDWYICSTSGISLGKANTSPEWQAP